MIYINQIVLLYMGYEILNMQVKWRKESF